MLLPNLSLIKLCGFDSSDLHWLSHLVLPGYAQGRFEADTLATFLSTRRAAGVPLKAVFLDAADDVETEDAIREWIKCEMGDKVDVSKIQSIMDIIHKLKAIPEVVFIRWVEGAVYDEELWQLTMS